MTDQTAEAPGQDTSAFTGPDLEQARSQIDTIMDLDKILSSARLVEKYEELCVRGDLVREFEELLTELGGLVDIDGNLLDEDASGEGSLADGPAAQVEKIQARLEQLRVEMKPATLGILFRAMSSDEWETFDKAHRTSSGQGYKDRRKFEHELIARCAVRPELTPVDVEQKLRKNLSQGQFVKLYNTAYHVNATDGLDVPKLPSFLAAPKPQE